MEEKLSIAEALRESIEREHEEIMAALDRVSTALRGEDPELSPGDPENCLGIDVCCDNCEHFLDCFPKSFEEFLEELEDIATAEAALKEHEQAGEKAHPIEEIFRELGLEGEKGDTNA